MRCCCLYLNIPNYLPTHTMMVPKADGGCPSGIHLYRSITYRGGGSKRCRLRFLEDPWHFSRTYLILTRRIYLRLPVPTREPVPRRKKAKQVSARGKPGRWGRGPHRSNFYYTKRHSRVATHPTSMSSTHPSDRRSGTAMIDPLQTPFPEPVCVVPTVL